MADLALQTLNPETGRPPQTRIADSKSLHQIVTRLIEADNGSALARLDVQKMFDGAPPFDETYLQNSGQAGRCNLNFGDGKAQLKATMVSYYDLTNSVPTLAMHMTEYGRPEDRAFYNGVLSEEWHRMLKDWKGFSPRYQLLVQKFCSHGVGFLYFKDETDWKWEVAGQDDFKLPRQVTVDEDEVDFAIGLRDVSVGKLYKWLSDADPSDGRWNKVEVRKAILRASDSSLNYSEDVWGKFEAIIKNNDLYVSAVAQDMVKLVHVWVREFSGKISHYITLRDGSNDDYLFKCENRFDSTSQCFTFFPYEVGTNGTLHSVRGKGHEIYPQVQVLNTLRCQQVDNARLSGSLLLQPKTPEDAEDMAILFYGGAAYIPPNLEVKNGQLNNPSQGMLPIIRDMSLLMRQNSGDFLSPAVDESNDKTKFQVQAELSKEAVLPTSSLDLFYEPWGRHLSETWRRTRELIRARNEKAAGYAEAKAFADRVEKRGVPVQAILECDRVVPMRAVGYGSPGNRLLALDEFMQYFGSLDPVGQNNLLRDRFAQKVTYALVDRYVPPIDANGRQPLDGEIAELQNAAMSYGRPQPVRPNDSHIIHLQSHLPDLDHNELDSLESGQGTPQMLQAAQMKIQHSAQHLKLLKPDKLNESIVAELTRQFNNSAERVQAAMDHAQRAAQKDAIAQRAAASQPTPPSPEQQSKLQDHALNRQIKLDSHELKMKIEREEADQRASLRDAETASKLRASSLRQSLRSLRPATRLQVPNVQPVLPPAAPLETPASVQPALERAAAPVTI